MNKVAHLHFHSEYSLLDSVIQVKHLPQIIEQKNIGAIALTDHGTVDGVIKFVSTTKDIAGFSPIVGCEFYVVEKHTDRTDKRRHHLTVLAKNKEGFKSMMRLLTIAHEEGFYYRPRVSWESVLTTLKDCVVMTACMDGMLSYPEPSRTKLVHIFHETYKDDFYLEAMLLTDFPPYRERNALIYQLHKKLGIPVVFTNDVHYTNKEDWTAREVLRAIGVGAKLDPKTYKKPDPNSTTEMYIKTYDEMVASLKKTPFADFEDNMVAVWDEIIAKTRATWLEPQQVSIPVAFEEARENPEKFLQDWCWQEFEKRKNQFSDIKQAEERLKYELGQICELGFASYFLLVADMVNWAKNNGIMVGIGRGTVGASIVAYLIGIIGINPLDYDLMFERFISPGRHDLPDIDVDYEDTKRDQVAEYLKKKYGENCVANVSTHMMMKGRGAMRDVGRVFGVPPAEVDGAAKQILVRSGGDARADFSIHDTVSLFEVAKAFKNKYPYVVEEAEKLEGVLKTKGIHAAGVVVNTDSLWQGDRCFIQTGKGGEKAVNWDKHDIEFMGLMKMDVLGLKTLNILQLIKKSVKERKGQDIVWENMVPKEEDSDPSIMELFQKGETVGVFQFGSAGMMQYLRNFCPKNFRDLYHVNALFRPGTLRSGMTSQFIINMHNPSKIEYINDNLKKILEPTYGIVLFQEQIMYILNKLGDIPWRTADLIRKVVSKSQGQEKFETFRQQFLDGVKRTKSMSEKDANKIFSLMKFFGSYGFNKAHSVEYTILGYWLAWAKVYHPVEFYWANLVRSESKEETSELLSDMFRRTNIRVALPDIQKSEVTWTIEDDTTLRAGLTVIKGISDSVAEAIVTARNAAGGWKGFKHFVNSVPRRIINISRIRSLLRAGVFRNWLSDDETKKILVFMEKNKRIPTNLPEDIADIDIAEYDVLFVHGEEIYNFEIAQEFYENNRRLIDVVKESLSRQGKILDDLKTIELASEQTYKEKWFLGKFDEIKYGYRQAVERQKSYTESKGYADDLGGVYGIFRDATSLTYATFIKQLYYRDEITKGRIENAAGQYMLVKTEKPAKAASNIFIQDMFFWDDIKQGIADGNLLRGVVSVCNPVGMAELCEEIKKCGSCKAREQCKAPVPFSKGMCNVMIVGRDPGHEEDTSGVPFVGAAGQLLWKTLREVMDADRSWFYVTNLQKCQPEGNNYNDRTSQVCRKLWLEKEITMLQPRLILSLGSQVGQFFTGTKNFKITELNGRCFWSERWAAWIVYSVHPASILYGAQKDITPLKTALEKFATVFLELFE